ncbi:hypothetical protein FKM82_009713 [Ascaphus truei]
MAEVAGGGDASASGHGGGESVSGAVSGPTAAAEDLGDGAAKTETGETGESEQDETEDVFEVERIIDSKTEGGEVLYRVRWKGYSSEEDTWEPEAHLDECSEVLLAFRRQHAECKPKPVKKEIPKLSLSLSDVFEAQSDSETQHEPNESSPQKKKKKSREEEEKAQEELRKKKSKSGKSKERSKLDTEQSENQIFDPKPKKRTSESKDDLNNKKNKKHKKEEFKESKKIKKVESKVKEKEEFKERDKERKQKKEKTADPEQPSPTSQGSRETSAENLNVSTDISSEDRGKYSRDNDSNDQEMVPDLPEEPPTATMCVEEDSDEVKMKRKKKKKLKKLKGDKEEESKWMVSEEHQGEKKSSHKKQKHVEKVKELPALEKLLPTPVLVQKSSRPSIDEKARRSIDSLPEEKETRKTDILKERPRKKHESEKEGRKEQKVIKNSKEPKNTYDAFRISPEDINECTDNSRRREETSSFDVRSMDDYKAKDIKQVYKERRNTRDESDTWGFAASEGDQEVMDTMCHVQENSAPLESKTQVSLGMDLQLEWMTLEDFQKHLDGSDEILPTEAISSTALKEAVKNGDYLTVKFALNSVEEYNLDQEDSSGMTLVMMAAAAGQDDLLRLLVKKGAKINARQKNGTTALIHAAEKNYLATVAILLEAGAYVNVQQTTGETALMKACKRGNSDIVRLLIEHGADCNVLSKHMGSAIQFAKQSNNVQLFELLKNHLETLSRVVGDAIRDYFETRLVLLEPIFPIACHRLCEGPDFSLDFTYKPPYNIPEGCSLYLFLQPCGWP